MIDIGTAPYGLSILPVAHGLPWAFQGLREPLEFSVPGFGALLESPGLPGGGLLRSVRRSSVRGPAAAGCSAWRAAVSLARIPAGTGAADLTTAPSVPLRRPAHA